MTRSRANVCLLLAGAIWGMGFVAQSTAMEQTGPMQFLAARFVIAAMLLAPLAWFETRRQASARVVPPSAVQALQFVLIGIALFAGMGTQQVGLVTTSVSNSGFLTGLYVVFTPVISIVLFRVWPARRVWPAIVLALCGIFLLSGGSLTALGQGDWMTILCAIFFALQVALLGRYAGATEHPYRLAFMQFSVCAVLGVVAALLLEPVSLPVLLQAWPEIVYTGVFASALAFTLQVFGQRYTTAAQAALFLSSEALFAALFGAGFLGERLTVAGLLGCGLILLAMLLVELGGFLRWPRMARRRVP